MNVAINGGSNAFHGQVYTQYTGDNLDAGDRGYWQRSPANADWRTFFARRKMGTRFGIRAAFSADASSATNCFSLPDTRRN